MNEYFCAPEMCQNKGGFYNYVCEFHAFKTGRRSVCLFHKQWKIIRSNKCPNKKWQKNRIPLLEEES